LNPGHPALSSITILTELPPSSKVLFKICRHVCLYYNLSWHKTSWVAMVTMPVLLMTAVPT